MEQISLTGIELDFDKSGNGPPLLYLHSEHYFHLQAPFIERLAEYWTVYVPRHPGFDGRHVLIDADPCGVMGVQVQHHVCRYNLAGCFDSVVDLAWMSGSS